MKYMKYKLEKQGTIGIKDDKTNASPGRPFIPSNGLKFGKAARNMFIYLP